MAGYNNTVELAGRATLWKEQVSGTRPLLAVMELARPTPAPAPATAHGRRSACCDALCRAPYCLRKPIYGKRESGEAPMAIRR